jgi:hypothetical protein
MNDKTLGIQRDITFTQPESMKVETFMDYENFAEKYKDEPDAENTDAGSGTSDDYQNLQLEPDKSVGPESQINETEQKIIQEAKKEAAPKTDTKKTEDPKTEDSKTPARKEKKPLLNFLKKEKPKN